MKNVNNTRYGALGAYFVMCMLAICVKSSFLNIEAILGVPHYKLLQPTTDVSFPIPETENIKVLITTFNDLAYNKSKYFNDFVNIKYEELQISQKHNIQTINDFTKKFKIVINKKYSSERAFLDSLHINEYLKVLITHIDNGSINILDSIKLTTDTALDSIMDYSNQCRTNILYLISKGSINAKDFAKTCSENIKSMANSSTKQAIEFNESCMLLISELLNVSRESIEEITDTLINKQQTEYNHNPDVLGLNLKSNLINEIQDVDHTIQDKDNSLKNCIESLANTAECQANYIAKLVETMETSVTFDVPKPPSIYGL